MPTSQQRASSQKHAAAFPCVRMPFCARWAAHPVDAVFFGLQHAEAEDSELAVPCKESSPPCSGRAPIQQVLNQVSKLNPYEA